MTHVGHEGEELAENPGAESPERIPRRMRNAKVSGGCSEFAGILQSDRRTEGIKINRERYESGRPERRPIELREKLIFHTQKLSGNYIKSQRFSQ